MNSTKSKIFVTFCCLAGAFIHGADWGLLASSIVDLKNHFSTTYEKLHLALTGNTPGSLLGLLLGGFIGGYPQFKLLYLIGVGFIIDGIIFNIMLHLNLVLFGIQNFLFGFVYQAKDTALIMLVLKLWGCKSSLPMHLSVAFGTVGQVSAVLIAWPFLATNNMPSNHSTEGKEEVLWHTTWHGKLNSTKLELHQTEIHWAFMINGVACFLVGTSCFLVAYLFQPVAEIERHKGTFLKEDKLSFNSLCCCFCLPEKKVVHKYVSMILLFFIVCVAIRAKDSSVRLGLMPVALESELHFSTDTGVMLKAFNFMSRALGRTILGILSHFISIKLYSVVCITLQLFFMALIAFYGIIHPVLFWICVPVHGFFASVALPAAISLFDRYIRITGFILAFSGLSYPLGNAIATYLNGYILEQYNAKWILVEAFGFSVVMFSGVLGITILGNKFGDRFIEDDKPSEEAKPLMSDDEEK